MLELKVLLLLMVANGGPIIACKLLGNRLGAPIDGHLLFLDGRPLLGPSKTIRGVISAVVVTVPAAVLLGWHWYTGVLFAVFAMLGDLIASFTKRRMGMPPSSMAVVIDQVPEAILPLIVLQNQLGLDWKSILIIVVAFTVGGLLASRILFKLKIRQRPY